MMRAAKFTQFSVGNCRSAHGWLHSTVLGAALAVAGCAVDDDPQLQLSVAMSASTVGDYSNAGCSTAVVIGLSKQIAEQANCEHPGSFVEFTASAGITFASSAVLPYIDKAAGDDLAAVGETDPLTVTSGLRTLAQQYLLVSWFQQSMCGITAAAAVGNSNHEGGRAVDISNYDAVITDMAAHGWAHDVSNDPVHFDHTASPDNRGEDIHAFQVLWNLNNPSDQIAEDGKYGPMTEAKLMASPATGFAMGPTCNVPPPPPPGTRAVDVLSIAGPDRALPMITVHYAMVLKNTGNVDWPDSTTLDLASGASSKLHDKSWTSDTVVMAIGKAVPVGTTVTVAFNVSTPAATAETPVSETFALDDNGMQFGKIDLALTVTPDMSGSMSADGGDNNDGKSTGGCNTAGGGASLTVLLALGFIRRRRRI